MTSKVEIRRDFAPHDFEGCDPFLGEQPIDVPLGRAARAAALKFEFDGRFETFTMAFERPLHALFDALPHRGFIAGSRSRKLAVKIFEREVKGRSVRGRGRTAVLDRSARIPVKPFPRALGVRVESGRTEMLLARRDTGRGFGYEGLGERDLGSSGSFGDGARGRGVLRQLERRGDCPA